MWFFDADILCTIEFSLKCLVVSSGSFRRSLLRRGFYKTETLALRSGNIVTDEVYLRCDYC